MFDLYQDYNYQNMSKMKQNRSGLDMAYGKEEFII